MAKKKKKKKTGRKQRNFTDEQKEKITQMALDNCHMDTIALALSIPKETLVRRFGTFIRQKRAEGRTLLRRAQREQIKNPAMAIFLGKNELGQTDKKEYALSGEISLKPPQIA
jgi:transposase-like protein